MGWRVVISLSSGGRGRRAAYPPVGLKSDAEGAARPARRLGQASAPGRRAQEMTTLLMPRPSRISAMTSIGTGDSVMT